MTPCCAARIVAEYLTREWHEQQDQQHDFLGWRSPGGPHHADARTARARIDDSDAAGRRRCWHASCS